MMLVLLLLFSLFLFLINISRFIGNGYPPGPNVFQTLANFPELCKNPHVALRNLAKTYGPLMSFRVGFQFVVVASSPSIAKEILQIKNRVFCGRYLPYIHYSLPGVIQASIAASKECDTNWKFLKSLGQRWIFSPATIQRTAGIRKEKCMEVVEFLKDNKSGKIVNIEHIAFAAFINITSNILASRDMLSHGAEGESHQMLMRIINGLLDNSNNLGVGDLFPFLRGLDFRTKSRAWMSSQMGKQIWSDILQKRKVSRQIGAQNYSHDFLDILIENSFTDDQATVLLTGLLIAGTESAAIVTVWMMAELIKNQEILHRVTKEIHDQAIEGPNNLISQSLLSDCQYFQACIKETLRLHIPSPFITPQRATEACKVSGYAIPKDSVVIVNAWAIHTDLDYWDDATVFKPDRFLNSTIDFKSHDFQYIPFSAGSRMCPGPGIALAGLQLMVASLVHYFEWSASLMDKIQETWT